MAKIQAAGIESTPLTDYKQAIEALFTNAFGADFNLDPETAQGQMIGQLAFTLTQIDNAMVDMFNATDIYSATGKQIDYIASNLGIYRHDNESDALFQRRYLQSVAMNATSQREAMYARIRAVKDNVAAVVVQNDTDTKDETTKPALPAHSISCVVLGGENAEIAKAIAQTKPIGIPTVGDTQVVYHDAITDADAQKGLPIRFYKASMVPLTIEMKITRDYHFPSDGLEAIRANLVAYIKTLNIDEHVYYSRLYAPITAVGGNKIDTLKIGRDSQLDTKDVVIHLTEIATLTEDNIKIECN